MHKIIQISHTMKLLQTLHFDQLTRLSNSSVTDQNQKFFQYRPPCSPFSPGFKRTLLKGLVKCLSMTLFSEKSPTSASVNWCLINTFTGGDDSVVAFLSHRRMLFGPRRLATFSPLSCHRVTTELGQLQQLAIALIHNSFGYIISKFGYILAITPSYLLLLNFGTLCQMIQFTPLTYILSLVYYNFDMHFTHV